MGKGKKVLSFVMALAMAFTVFAGAVNGVSYTDSEQFRTDAGRDATEILTSLGVIHGFPDGTFRPGQSVTRAELAKMIYIIKTGDAQDSPFYDEADMSKIFYDVYSGHWASKYINFCYLNGIIAGYGDGTFRPEQAVSMTEAAKMILVALGYKADVEGLEGKGYDKNTLRLAQKNGLLKNLNGTMQTASDRENAVIMLQNGLFADTVMYVGGVAVPRTTTMSSQDTITLAEEGFDLLDVTGILVANDDAALGAYHHDAVSNNETPYKRYSVTADGTSAFLFKDYTANATGAYERTVIRVAYDAEFDMLGREYRLLVTKPDRSDRSVKIYGEPIETASNTIVETGSINVEKETVDKLFGTKIAQTDDVDYTVFINGKPVSFDEVRAQLEEDTNARVIVVSNDGNENTVEYIFATTQIIGEVKDVREDGMTIAGDGMGTLENHELRFDGEIPVKGDYVVASFNEASEVWTVKKLIKITGQITGYNGIEETYRIGEFDYKKSDIMPAEESALMGSGASAIAGAVLTYWTDVDGDTRFIIRAQMNEGTSYAQYGLFLWSDVENKPYQYHTMKFMTQENTIEYRQVATVNGMKATATDLTALTEGDVFGYVVDEDGFIHVTTEIGLSETASLVYDRVTDTFSDVNAGHAPYKHVNGTIFVTYGQPSDSEQEQFKWKAFSGGSFDTALANSNEAKVAANVLTSVTPNVEMPDRIKWNVITGGVRNIEVASLSFDDYAKFGYLLPGLTVNKDTEVLATVLSTAMTYENGKYFYTITYAGANGTETHTIETVGHVAPIGTIKVGHIYKLTVNSEGKAEKIEEYTVNNATHNDGIEREAYTVDTIYKNADGTYQLSVKKLVESEGKPYFDTLNVTVNPAKTDIFFVDGLFTQEPEMWDRNELPTAGTAINNDNFRVWIDFDVSSHEIHHIWIDSKPSDTYATVTLSDITPTKVDFAEGKFTYGFADTASIATTYSKLIPVESLVAYGEEDSKFALTAGETYSMVVKGNVVVDIID